MESRDDEDSDDKEPKNNKKHVRFSYLTHWSYNMDISTISSVLSHISRAIISAPLQTDEGEDFERRMELDSHADSTVLSINSSIVSYTGVYVTVSGFIDSLGKKREVPIVDAIIAYDCDIPGATYILYV
jgi:predicted transcriptional regulator